MATTTGQSLALRAWALVRRQHGVVARWQLLELGYTPAAIRHRIAVGRLHPVHRGVYAVGRRELTRRGHWMAAVLACGPGAVLSHESAAALFRLRKGDGGSISASVPARNRHRPAGIRVHRRRPEVLADATTRDGIPVTSPLRTLVDLAAGAGRGDLEALVNEADKIDLIDPETLRARLDDVPTGPGVRALRTLLDTATFTLTDSELERRFLPIARRAGLPKPETQQRVNGFRVDFYWPDLGLVVETDGLRYHRTPAQQARDRRRDNAHLSAGLTPVRFTHAQVRYEPAEVERTLGAVVAALRTPRGRRSAP
jgi:very-short-patch-repair endonuclease